MAGKNGSFTNELQLHYRSVRLVMLQGIDRNLVSLSKTYRLEGDDAGQQKVSEVRAALIGLLEHAKEGNNDAK